MRTYPITLRDGKHYQIVTSHDFQKGFRKHYINSFKKPVKSLKTESIISVSSAGYIEEDKHRALFLPRRNDFLKRKDITPYHDMIFVEPLNNENVFFMGGTYSILKNI